MPFKFLRYLFKIDYYYRCYAKQSHTKSQESFGVYAAGGAGQQHCVSMQIRKRTAPAVSKTRPIIDTL